jgi:hypothetical protein
MKYIRIRYWPETRVYSDPNKLAALKPETWGRMSRGAREAWAKSYLRHQCGSKAEYLGWVDSEI